MNRFIIIISIICLLCIFFFLLNDNKQYISNYQNDQNQQIISNKLNDQDIPLKYIEDQNFMNLKNVDVSKDINDIFHSEDILFSENTNQLISNSYNELLTNVYKNINMKINFNHMGSNNIIDFDIKLIKDTELSNNFIQNIRNYTNSSIFNFDDSCGALFLGDYLNNNGTANYTVNHSLLEVKHKLSNFIPANSISMIGIKQENGLFIGSQFIINFFNITDKNFINKYNIIPFGTFSIENDESKIYSFIQNYFNKNKNIKPKIVFINESNLLQNNDLLL